MVAVDTLTVDRLREVLDYNPHTGVFHFTSIEAAQKAYMEASHKYHGEYARVA